MSQNARSRTTTRRARSIVRQARRAIKSKGPAWLSAFLALVVLLSLLPPSSYAAGSLAPATGVRVLGVTAGVGLRQGEIEGAAVVAVTFSEPMNLRSAETAFSIKPPVQGAFTWQKATLLFTPAKALSPGTTYTVTVGKSARASRGPAISAPFSYSFTTAPPPTVLRTLPSPDASEVPTDTILTLSFDRLMSPLDSLSNTPDAGRWVTISPALRGRWFWLGTATVGFRPERGFLPGTEYSVEVKPGWPDAAGVPLQSGLSFRFSTLAPGVVSSSPADTATSRAPDVPVVVRFNQPVDRATAQSAFSLVPETGGAPVSGTYSWSPESTVMTFTPASLLAFDAGYDAAIRGPLKPLNAAFSPSKVVSKTWHFTVTTKTRVSYHTPEGTTSIDNSSYLSIAFTNPLKPGQDVASFVSITPQPEQMSALEVSSDGSYIRAYGMRLLPDTTYRVEVKPGLLDKWGFPVESETWEVRTTPLVPGLSISGGSFQPVHTGGPSQVGIQVTNLTKLHLALYSLTEQEVLSNIDSSRTFNTLLREWDVEVPASNSVSTVYPVVAADATSDRLAPGYYFLRATSLSPRGGVTAETAVVLMVGRTGLIAKNQGADLLVWATDLLTGRPMLDYPLRVEERVSVEGKSTTLTQQGRTGPDGVLRLKLQQDSRGITAWSEQPGDAAVVSTNWGSRARSSGYDGYDSYSPYYRESASQAAIYTDRPIYRPGQTVYFSGIYRHDDDASYSLPPANTTLYLHASDPVRDNVYTTTLSLSALGTFNGQFALPASAPTGPYILSVDDRTPGYYEIANVTFRVEEYRKPDFEVNVTTREGVTHGEPVTATLSTSYYFGGPLAYLTATVEVQDSPYSFEWADPQTGEWYQFGEDTPDETRRERTYERSTDGQGLLVLDLGEDVDTSRGSRSLAVEGQVQDLSNQRVAKRGSLIVHQGLYYIGLHEDTYIGEAGQPLTYTLRTVAPDAKVTSGGRVVPGVPLTVRVLRQEWSESDLRETEVATGSVTTDAEGRARYAFTPEVAGSFRLVVEGTDRLGNKLRSSLKSWVSSLDSGYVQWRYSDDRSVDLVPDKVRYSVGDTARLLVTSPFTEATALLTVERGHLRRYSVVTLNGGAPVVEVRLEEGDLPNVHIGITLLGRGRAPASAPPGWVESVQMRGGSANLHVSVESKRVRVSLEPQGQGGLEPGGTTNVLVRTTGYDGKPAPTELSLAVVDEPIFALADDNSAGLFDAFWFERPSQVTTSSNYRSGQSNSVSTGAPLDVLPVTGGGGYPRTGGGLGPEGPARVRSDFRDTALWRAAVTTGADGTALVAVRWPDNLTTWRLTAHAVTADTSLGTSVSKLTVTQPLLVRPVTPRFLVTGDHPRVQAVVHNNTGATLQLEASLVVSGALSLDARAAPSRRLILSPGTQATVSWDTKVGAGDTGGLRYWVRTVGKVGKAYLEDAVAMQLPVKVFAAPEMAFISGEVTGTHASESIYLPYSEDPLSGELVVNVVPSLAAATSGGVQYLVDFEHACTEQTTSRYLPLVVLEHAYKSQGLKTAYSDRLPDIMQRAFNRLREIQHSDGAWGWWDFDDTRWWQTAYVVHGLIAARNSGYDVPEELLRPGLDKLRAFMLDNGTHGLDQTSLLNVRAYTLYLLTQAWGTGDSLGKVGLTEHAKQLLGRVPEMGVHARSWLAMSLARLGLSQESATVLDSVVAAARQDGPRAYWGEAQPDYAGMGTDSRATAIALDALITIRPNDPLIPKVVRWLMSISREGHWDSTQDTSFILIAIAHYLEASKELSANYTWQASAFGTNLGGGVVGPSNLTQTQTLKVPVASLPRNSRGSLEFTRSSPAGKMYYQMTLRYFAPGEPIEAVSKGFSVARSYYSLDGTEPVRDVRAGDLVKVRLMITVPRTSYYVVVTDPLPGGLEAVNGSLNTTSFSERPPDANGSRVEDEDDPSGYRYNYWGLFNNVEMRDDRTLLYATDLSPGTYVYEYFARATTPGVYMSLPASAEQMYQPQVHGHSDGGVFTVK